MTDYDALFAPVPGRVLREVVEQDLPGEALRVALALLLHCSPNNPKCNPGQRTLARLSGVHLRNVPRAIARLVDAGIISTMPGAGKRTTIYRFEVWIESDAKAAKQPPAKPSAKGFDLHAEIDKLAGGSGQPSGNPEQLPEAGPEPDPTIKSLLHDAGVRGPKLDKAASNEHLTVKAVKDFIAQAEDKTNPAAWLASCCANYEPSKGGGVKYDEHGRIDNWPEPRPDSAEVHEAITAEQYGLTVEQFRLFQAEQRKHVEANPDITPEQAGEHADDLIARIKAGEYDG